MHLLEQVLLASLGPEAFTGLFDGTTSAASPEVTAAPGDHARLLTDADPDRDRLDWQDATQRVVGGDAAFVVTGDWAPVPFEEAGVATGADVVWSPVPGTAGSFDLVVDAFALPAGAARPARVGRSVEPMANDDLTPEQTLETLEREGWAALVAGGSTARDFYDRVLDDGDVLMLLPGGLMLADRAVILQSIGDSPWKSADLEDFTVTRPTPDTGLVAYSASARRDDAEYAGVFSSLYVRRGEEWRLVFHQQTPH